MASGQDNSIQAFDLTEAAQMHGVPASILTGVWGMETDFGRNVATSSAGAVGDFQFLPSTAKQWNYPLTNKPDLAQFQQQANAAAAYLQSLKKQFGSWDAALQHYSGGGYGLAQVSAKAHQAPLAGLIKNDTGIGGPAGAVIDAAGGIPGAISGVFSSLVNDAKYAGLFIAALALGALMIFHGAIGMGGSGGKRTVVVPV